MGIIYFVEDDKSIRYIIKKTITHAGLTGSGFENGEDFLKKFKSEKPDMVLLDIMLPDISGLELLKIIRKLDTEIPIMMVSALQSEIDKVIALDLGADDYMVKPFGVLELTSRIQAKLRMKKDSKIYSLKDVILDDKRHAFLVKDKDIYLTNKEFSIMKLLLKNKTAVVSKDMIFSDVWQTDFIGETRTLDMHIKALRAKLASNDSVAKIKTIRGIGYQVE